MSLAVRPETRDGDLTLLFTLSAARSLADPAAAFADARRWSRYVGIVANDRSAVAAFERDHGVDNDYKLRNWDKWGTVQDLYDATDTPRHVMVGTTREDRRIAAAVGWEFRTVREAADRAGWAIKDPSANAADRGGTGTGSVIGRWWARLRRVVRDRLD